MRNLSKSNVLCGLAYGAFGFTILSYLVSIPIAIAGAVLSYKIPRENGYDAANAEYREERISEINEQYKNGELSHSEYTRKMGSIGNMEEQEYMFSDEDVPQEAREDYTTAQNMLVSSVGLIGAGTAVFVAGGILNHEGNDAANKEFMAEVAENSKERTYLYRDSSHREI